jgi:small subunit ribosomal protein S1
VEGAQLQLRILRIDADRRRLGLSLRQAEELDSKEATQEQSQAEAAPQDSSAPAGADAASAPSLESLATHQEHGPSSKGKGERRERQERANDNSILRGLPSDDAGEMTAMAEAFRAAARQRSSK